MREYIKFLSLSYGIQRWGKGGRRSPLSGVPSLLNSLINFWLIRWFYNYHDMTCMPCLDVWCILMSSLSFCLVYFTAQRDL